MILVRPMSIRDYLNPQRVAGIESRAGKDENRNASSFAEILKQHTTTSSGGQANGLRISDYRGRPVLAQHSPKRSPALTEATDSEPTPSVRGRSEPGPSRTVPSLGLAVTQKRSGRTSPVAAHRSGSGQSRGQTPADETVESSIQEAAAKYRLSPDLIRSVIRAESDFQPDAVSPAGAQGLMQLMPGTAEELGVTNPFDVRQNIDGGSRYLRQMLDQFGGNLKLALAAYNAGPGAVTKYNGQVPYPETKEYVKRVVRFYGERA